MTAWEIIKERCTGGKRVGSFGYLQQLNVAADIFTDILPRLKNGETEAHIFNNDMEVREALINRGFINTVANIVK